MSDPDDEVDEFLATSVEAQARADYLADAPKTFVMPDEDEPEEPEVALAPLPREPHARPVTIPLSVLKRNRHAYPVVTEAERAEFDAIRPKTRADCASVVRPCPFVSCSHSTYLDVNEKTGSLRLNFPDIGPEEQHPLLSCALDLAERGEMTLDEVGIATNRVRERIRQIEDDALVNAGEGIVRSSGTDWTDDD